MLYGGAAGGGKTDFLIIDFLGLLPRWGKDWQGIVFRRTFSELEEMIKRAKELYTPIGGEWISGHKLFMFPNGASVRFSYLERDNDVTRYQGAMNGPAMGRMNIMTYYGYASGSGETAEDPFGYSVPGPPGSPFYEFNKRAFAYATGGMPPPWFPTKQVYIIRHADGVSYSKLQVTAVSYKRGYIYILGFQFANLDE